jgi:DNA-directed RNA polymerase II subunit RPB2
MEVDIPEIIHMSNPITSFGSPEIPLAGPRSALATATGLSTTAANALMGGAGGADGSLGKKVQHEYEVTLEFEKISIRKPTIFENNGAIHPMMPNDARLRNLTYASPLNVDVKVTTTFIDHTRNGIRESNVRIFPNVHLGKIPVMVGSKYCLLNDQKHVHPSKLGECPEDVGGYFIIQGGERAMISMERMSENRPFVFRNGRGNAKEMEVVEIKCIGPDNDQVPKSNTVKMVYHPKNQLITMLRATVPRIKTDIPLIILFRALGVLADKNICELILGYDKDNSYDHIITESILEASSITTQDQALAWLGEHTNTWSVKSQKQNNVAEILGEELFPQIGGVDMNYEKACFLAHMTRKVLWTSSQRIPTDDRDAYPNKRVDVPGFLLADLFRKTYNNRMVKDMKAALSKEIHGGSWKATGNWTEIVNINNINKIIKSTILDVCLKSSLATGKFGSGKIGGPSKDGVSQVLNRLNYMATISHLRRISTPIEKSGKLVAPRKQHNTQFGFICPCETPEGHGVGIIKNMATTTGITIFSSPVTVYAYIQSLNKLISLRESSIDQKHAMARVFLNGSWIGLLPNDTACEVVDSLRQAKRRGQIHIHTGIIWKNAFKELWITTEAGRVIRPLYYAPAIREIAADKTGALKKHILAIKDWNQLMLWETPGGKQLFEYVDAGETEGTYIAMDYDSCIKEKSHTHCEIHPSVLFGTTASCIPFPDHNQSPRNAYQASMGKQAMGVYALNFRERFDAMAHVLCYPEIPMVSPFMSKFYGAQSLPTGQNVVVAIMTYSGYNQEDSIMINRAALERGRYRSIFYRTYKDEERKNQSSGEEEKFCSPDPVETKHMKNAHYEKVAEDGFVPKDTYVTPDDILIGKVVPLRVATGSVVPVGAKKQRDVSKMPRNNESGFVDKIYKNRNGEGYNFVKIRMRQDRVPEIGDKFASRHAQKGTTGMILNPEDMPQTASGIVPDIIINPHCLAEDHEILTEAGFMNWKEVQKVYQEGKVRLAGYNHESGNIVYEYPTAFILNDKKMHDMIDFTHIGEKKNWTDEEDIDTCDTNSNGVSLLVTTDHDMFAKKGRFYNDCVTWDGNYKGPRGDCHRIQYDYEKCKANTLLANKKNDAVKFIGKARNGINNADSKMPQIMSELDLNTPEQILAFCEFYGYWLGDGCLRFGGNSVEVSPVKKVDDVWLRKRFDTMGLKEGQHYTYNIIGNDSDSSPTRYRWSIIDKKWFNLFCSEYGHKYSKYANATNVPNITSSVVPENIKSAKWMAKWVWEVSAELAVSILSGLRMADGCEKADRNAIWTSSARFRDEIMRLALHAGYSSKFIIQHNQNDICGKSANGTNIVAKHISWKVSYSNMPRTSEPVLNAHRDIKQTTYFGHTWCVTMPNGFIITRRAVRDENNVVIKASRPIITGQCIPSRMTIAQLMETLLSKIGCMAGCLGDASPFNSTTVEGLASILRDKYGMEPHGNEIMYNGYTGRMMETSIFIGPCYYQRLRHCSADKMHSRASGPLVMLTRQPAEGRAREGGLRFGKYLPKCGIKPMLVPYGGATLSNSGKLSQETKFDNICKILYYFKMPDTTWKIINNYDNYSISNKGEVKNNTTRRILKYYIRNGYNSVTLSKDNCKKTFNIHNLVAEHFLKKPTNKGYVVNHIDEDKLNNNLDNLEYITYRDNTLYSANSDRNKNTNSYNIEEFVDIPHYTRYKASKIGEIYSTNIKRLCRITILPNGYHKIKLKDDNNVYKDLYIHVIVAMTYLNYTPSENYVINHIDGNKGNNSIDNLEVITHKDNMKHSVMINNHKLYRRAVCYTDDNNNIIAYKSAKEASINMGIDNSSILKSCKSDNKTAGNIKWRFYV